MVILVTRRTPNNALLCEAYPPDCSAPPAPRRGSLQEESTLSGLQVAPTLRPTPSHYLCPTPSHRVVRPQSGFFPQDAYVGLVREYALRRKHHLTTSTTIFSRQPRHGTVQDEDIFGASRHKAQRPTISRALRKQAQPYPTTMGAFRSFTFPWTGIDIPHH